jgi:hypothetical protein
MIGILCCMLQAKQAEMHAELGRREEAMMLEAQRASLEEGSNEVALAGGGV